MAADDVAAAVGRVAVGAPLNGRVEIAGPERFRIDEFFRRRLAACDDPREVVTDPHARYFGAELDERSLVPDDGAHLGAIRTRTGWARHRPRSSAAGRPTGKAGPRTHEREVRLMSRSDRMPTDAKPRSTAWKTALTVLQEAEPPFIPAGAHAMTVVVQFPPGDPGTPPHRHTGPAFGYVLEGEMLFELEGQPERVVRAGETFWEPGGDLIHYQDGNHRDDVPLRFTVTMLCEPGRPMLTLVDDEELAQRVDRRAPPAVRGKFCRADGGRSGDAGVVLARDWRAPRPCAPRPTP